MLDLMKPFTFVIQEPFRTAEKKLGALMTKFMTSNGGSLNLRKVKTFKKGHVLYEGSSLQDRSAFIVEIEKLSKRETKLTAINGISSAQYLGTKIINDHLPSDIDLNKILESGGSLIINKNIDDFSAAMAEAVIRAKPELETLGIRILVEKTR